VRNAYGLAVACGLAAYVIFGGATAEVGPVSIGALVLWSVFIASRVRTKLSHAGEAPLRTDLELGALLSIGLDAALVRFEGTLSGSLSPAVYVLVALVAAFARPGGGLLVVVWVVVLEALVRRFTLHEMSLDALIPHAAFVAAFAVLNLAFLRAEVARIRASAHARVEGELHRLKDDARRYRLLGAGESGHVERSEDRLARSSVEEIHQSVHYALELLRRSLGLHTAVLLWLNDAGTHLKISELSTESDDIHDAPFAAGDGVLGAVMARRERVSLTNLKPSYKVPYYASGCPVRVLAAIPVLDDSVKGDTKTLRGILAIDRSENKPFTPHEEELAAQAARYCLRAIQNERVFVQLERAKVEQGKLYRAAQAAKKKCSTQACVRRARSPASISRRSPSTIR
jgi:two-component system cell cycle response regulator